MWYTVVNTERGFLSMVKFIIVRHGFSVFNKEHRFTGQIDIPLDEIGVAQAACNADYVLSHYKIDCVYSSDLCRAYNTVKPIADALGLPITTSEGLRELSIGEWEGALIAEIKQTQPEALAFYRSRKPEACTPGGETKQHLQDRLTGCMAEIAAQNDGKTVLIGSHGGAIRFLCCAWMGYSIEELDNVPTLGNASLTVVNYDPQTGKAEFELYGYTDHLGELATQK